MIELSVGLNIAGLALDIIGVVLVFLFGLPPMVNPEGHSFIVDGTKDETEIQRASIYQHRGQCGLGLVVVGFLLQAAGNGVVLF